MIQDKQTNIVYLPEGLSTFQPFFTDLINVLHSEGIAVARIPRTARTEHIWARDYMPIQVGPGRFLRYKYAPDYLRNDRKYVPCYRKICSDLGLCCTTTDIVLDGGNVVPCGEKVVLTDKIFRENPGYGRQALVEKLERLLEAEVVIIPWDRYEMFGHADGMVRHLDGKRVLINNYGNLDPQLRRRLLEALQPHFEVEELYYNVPRVSKLSWIFLNYIQVKNCIFVPSLPIPENKEFQTQIRQLLPNATIRSIAGIELIALAGGGLHCISWNILGDLPEVKCLPGAVVISEPTLQSTDTHALYKKPASPLN